MKSAVDGVVCFCLETSVDLVNFNAPGDGVYAIVMYPRCERFDLPVLGCLYAVRMHRHISVRCPKGSVITDLHCDLQVPRLHLHTIRYDTVEINVRSKADGMVSLI